MLLRVLLFLCVFPPSTAKGRLREFHRGPERVTRMIASNECKKRSYTELVTVYDQQDDMELSKLLTNSIPSGWIGALIVKPSKKWSNGDEVTYKKDFEMGSLETCCATMKADGDWESLRCNHKRQFMCYEQDVGQASYNYKLIPEDKTWFEAQLYCRENHTDLASIRNEEENKQVMEARGKDRPPCWIGLLKDSVEWNDGGQSAYRNWISEHLQLKDPDVFMSSYPNVSWSKTNNNEYHPLCYKSLIHVSEDEMSWERALDYCKTQQNTTGLLCIESKDDQIETERELKRQNISGPVWVGLRQSRLFGFWFWSNGLNVGPWTNWKEGSAPEHLISEHCGAIEMVNGQYKWCDKDCRSEFQVLCERKLY